MHVHKKALPVIALAMLAATPSALDAAPAAPVVETAFVGVTVVPMDRERVLLDQTVIVRGDRIVALGPSETTPLAKEARRIAGKGRFLLPGLADMHVHLDSAASLTLLIANGVTFARNMWGTPQHLLWRERIRKGELLGPTIYTAGPIVDGNPPVWSGSRVVEHGDEAEGAVVEQQAAGYDFVKVYNNLSASAYDALVLAAARHHMPIAGHIPTHVPLVHALAGKLASIEHLTGYLVELQAADSPLKGVTYLAHRRHLAAHVDARRIPEIAAATARSGVANCVTLSVDQWFVPPAEIARMAAAPELTYLPPWMVASWRPDPNEVFPDEEYRMNEHAEVVLGKITHELVAAGARVLLGTDSPNPYVAPGWSVHRELRNLVAAGLTPFQALATGTRDAAAFLGQSGEWGTIAVGRRADLILLEGNPLGDVRNTERRAGVMVRGRWLPADEIANLLDKLVASYRPPANRFANMPELFDELADHSADAGPTAATTEWTAEWTESVGGAVFGGERAALFRRADGSRVLIAEDVRDAPDVERTTLRLELGPSDLGTLLDLTSDRPEGHAHVVARRAGGLLHVEGATPFNAKIREDIPIKDDEPLSGPLLGSDIALVSRLAKLAVGQSHDYSVKTLRIDPRYGTWDTRFHVTRGATPHGVEPGTAPSVATFSVEAHEQRWRERRVLELDASGVPVHLQIAQRGGTVDYRRVK